MGYYSDFDYEIITKPGWVFFRTPFSTAFNNYIKSNVPRSNYTFLGKGKDPENCWGVTNDYAQVGIQAILAVFGQVIDLPKLDDAQGSQEVFGMTLEIHYIGQPRDRGDGIPKATAFLANDQAGCIFPSSVLEEWFLGQKKPKGQAATFYEAMGLRQTATDTEIQNAFRRLAKLLHPDINREPDAADQFIAMQKAYEVLKDPVARKRYDLGLKKFGGLVPAQPKQRDFTSAYETVDNQFRLLLHCGIINIDGVYDPIKQMYSATKINSWKDITNRWGEVMVSECRVHRNRKTGKDEFTFIKTFIKL